MNTLSICSICQDEEDVIGWYLNCCEYTAKVVGDRFREVVIVDGGSKDNTVDIIKSYQDKFPLVLLEIPFDTFGQQKNRAMDKSNGDYIFGPDTDMTWTKDFGDVFLSGRYSKAPIWDFKLVFTVRDRLHYFCNWPKGPSMRLWKRGRKFITNFHEKLEGQCSGIPVCKSVVVFENSMRASDEALRHRGMRYQKFIGEMKAAGRGPGSPEKYISAKHAPDSEVGILPPALQNLILENT